MAMHILKNKVGQSLIEVMVALSILVVVFTATTNLMFAVTELTLSARTRTQHIALANSELAETALCLKQGGTRASCGTVDLTDPGTLSPGQRVLNVTVRDLISSGSGKETDETLKLDNTNFQKIVVLVQWKDKGTSSVKNITVTKIVRGRSS